MYYRFFLHFNFSCLCISDNRKKNAIAIISLWHILIITKGLRLGLSQIPMVL